MWHVPQRRQMSRYAMVLILVAAIGAGLWTHVGHGGAQPAADPPTLRKIAEFELPGPPGKRFDYLAIDQDDNYLLSAHLGAGLLHVSTFGRTQWSRPYRTCPASKASPTSLKGRRSTRRTGARTRSASSISLAWLSSSGFRPKPNPTASLTRRHFARRTCPTNVPRPRASSTWRTDTIDKVLALRQRDRRAGVRPGRPKSVRQPSGPEYAGRHRSCHGRGSRPVPGRGMPWQPWHGDRRRSATARFSPAKATIP